MLIWSISFQWFLKLLCVKTVFFVFLLYQLRKGVDPSSSIIPAGFELMWFYLFKYLVISNSVPDIVRDKTWIILGLEWFYLHSEKKKIAFAANRWLVRTDNPRSSQCVPWDSLGFSFVPARLGVDYTYS